MPDKRIKVLRLAHVHYQHPDLARASEFLEDFGLAIARKDSDRIYYAGYGTDPFCYIAEQSPDGKRNFLGGTFVTASEEDFQTAASHPSASPVQEIDAPGGGKRVSVTDPNGFPVNFIWGQQSKTPVTRQAATNERDIHAAAVNSAYEKPRQGRFRRFDSGPSLIHKAGHYGYMVPTEKYAETFAFYTTIMNLKPTDSVFDPESGDDNTCFMHIDLGKEYSDHHTFFLGRSPRPAHVHHTSFEVWDVDTQQLGHDWLQKKGWVNCWGIGRHVLGSQIFDYWFDASGNILEHYSDGDLVNEDTPWERCVESPNSLYIWGPNIPLAFVTGQVGDAGKSIPVLPQHEAAAAG